MGSESSSGHSGFRAGGFTVAVVLMVAASVAITALVSRFNGSLGGPPAPLSEGASGLSGAALQAEITRLRPALEAERVAIEAEQRVIQTDKKGLEGLKSRIDRRRRRGLVRAEFQLDQRDMTEYTRRSNALSARITEFNRRVEAQKLAVEEFNALVSQFNAGR